MLKSSYARRLVALSFLVFATGALLAGVSNAKEMAIGLGASQDTTQLMELAFPISKSIAGSDARLLETVSAPLPQETPNGFQEPSPSSERVTPLGLIVQDPSHVALITARTSSDEKGFIRAAHSDQAVIGVYGFVERQKGWELESRADNVVSAGFFGTVDSIEAARITATTYAISIVSSSCWQGYCGTWLTVIGLGTHHVEVWGDGIRLAANDIAAKAECADALRDQVSTILPSSPLPVEKTVSGSAASDASDVASDECFSITSQYAFAGISSQPDSTSGDLILSFKGLVVPTGSGTAEQRVSHAVDSVAIYKLLGGHYRLFAGTNPVPGL
jgi:hypothetical protein